MILCCLLNVSYHMLEQPARAVKRNRAARKGPRYIRIMVEAEQI